MQIRSLCAGVAMLLALLVWSPLAEARTGYASHGDLTFRGTVTQVAADRVQVRTPSGFRLWISAAADFTGGAGGAVDVAPGDSVVVHVPAGNSAVLRLNSRTAMLQTDQGPVEVPVSLLGSTLDSTQVVMRTPQGGQSVVTMRRGLDLIRHRGAGLVAAQMPRVVERVATAGSPGATLPAATEDLGTTESDLGTASAPSTNAVVGLGTLTAPSTAPSAGLGTLSSSSTGTRVGMGTANVSGSDSGPLDEIVLRGPDAAAGTSVGELNLTATRVLGTVETVGPTEVVLRLPSGTRLSVPAHYRMVGTGDLQQNLSPDMDVTLEIPGGSAHIVGLGENTVAVNLNGDIVMLPLELLPPSTTTDTRVRIQMANGSTQVMNLGDALLQIRFSDAEFITAE